MTYKRLVIIANLVLLLAFANYSIFKKESLLSSGKLIFLELAPVDPRSILQGDYMALNYRICTESENWNSNASNYWKIGVNKKNIAVQFIKGPSPDSLTNLTIKIHRGSYGQVLIGAESYFFQEGTAEKYTKARYGGIRLDEYGTALLEGLYDENLKPLK